MSELGSLDFAALLRHRYCTRPPAREVRMGKNMSAHESTAIKRIKLTKDLGTYSPHEIHMRKPMSGRAKRSTYAPILGFSSNKHRKDETCNAAGLAPQSTRDALPQARQPPQGRSQQS